MQQQAAGNGTGSKLNKVIPGVAASVPLVVAGYPCDTVKTRLQINRHLGMAQCIREIAAKEGLFSLYRGCSISLGVLSCKMALELSLFEWCSNKFAGSAAPFVGGMIGSTISTTMLAPLFVLKVQMQMAGTHANPAAAAAAVWQASGVRGFWHGLGANLAVHVPFSTLFFGTYGLLRDTSPEATWWSPALAGGTASIATWTVLQPLDTLRTIAMSKANHAVRADVSPSAFLRGLVQQYGIRSLWRGFAPVTLRALPSSGGSMLFYEWAAKMLAVGN